MTLNHLTILNYKNIEQAELDFSPKINCFVGSNGEGKTNLLDAIHFLSFTRSATNTIDALNLRHGEDLMMLSGQYDLNGTPEVISCGQRRGQKKIFRRGQKAYRRMSEHIGLLPLILISPADLQLIIGGSEERRRFIDIVISQYNAAYLTALQRYNRALQQRNQLLRQSADGATPPPDDTLIAAYEDMMATEGTYIYQERERFVHQLIPFFQHYYDRIAQGHEQVSLQYVSHVQRGPLLDIIRRDRARDLAVGYSLHGIHRDDLQMQLGSYPIRHEASQGQTKTYLISLKLAQFHLLQSTATHTRPILLLDDIFDRLDAERVSQIINLVAQDDFGQIFITDTNRHHLDRILSQTTGDYRIYNVHQGHIQ